MHFGSCTIKLAVPSDEDGSKHQCDHSHRLLARKSQLKCFGVSLNSSQRRTPWVSQSLGPAHKSHSQSALKQLRKDRSFKFYCWQWTLMYPGTEQEWVRNLMTLLTLSQGYCNPGSGPISTLQREGKSRSIASQRRESNVPPISLWLSPLVGPLLCYHWCHQWPAFSAKIFWLQPWIKYASLGSAQAFGWQQSWVSAGSFPVEISWGWKTEK